MAESPLPVPDSGDGAEVLLFRRYRVLRELGRGGMGVVLLAHDTALDVPMAVKLVPDLVVDDTEAIAELRKEVLRGMALTHPGVVRTHNFERDETGAGIVMEFIEGHTLSELKAQQPGGCFDPQHILPWLEQLCAVLDYAHREARIVHRDLKPRNVMLTSAGKLKVADFGIAAAISDSMSKHSMEGKLSGTLSYMSPQQAEGRRPHVTDDLHALGATIYELLTGKPPFFRGNQTAIYQQILCMVPPTMAERRAELEVRGKAPIPPPWEEAIAACLAKEPAERPQSAGEVLERLRQGARAARPPSSVSRGEPPAAIAPPTVPRRPLAPARARPRWPWAAGLAALALAAGGASYFADQRAPKPILGLAKPPAATPAQRLLTSAATPRPATPTPWPATPVPTPKPATLAPITLATATNDKPFINSLGLEFVPVPSTGVLFCRWETRAKDFAPFIADSHYDMAKGEGARTLESDGKGGFEWELAGGDWRNPRFPQPQRDDHPVVCVSWEDAQAFCQWLTNKERATGRLTASQRYRLPTDHEWSVAVGLGERGDAMASPESKDAIIKGVYPWGTEFPPKRPVANLCGQESRVGAAVSAPGTVIAGYNDGFARTAPVGSFASNAFGLHDLAGNVWEWCEDNYNSGAWRVLRGGSWSDGDAFGLRSSRRTSRTPTDRYDFIGFRCVVSVSGR